MVQSCSQARDNPDWDAQGGGCRDPFRNNITKIKTFIAAPMFIFLQYCKISRVSQLCGEAKSDSYRINYNFLPPLLNWNWCDIIPVKRKARLLHIHWHKLICANGKGDGSGSRSPTTSFLKMQTLHWCWHWQKGTSFYFPRAGTKCVLFLLVFKWLKSFINHCNSIPLFRPRS